MMKKVEKQKLQRLICQSLRSLCEAGLPDSTNICIEGLIGITVNSDHVILVGVHEEIGDGETEMMDSLSLRDSSHGVAGGGKSNYMSSLHAKMFQQTQAAVLREHMKYVMHAGMAAAQGIPPTDKSMRQFAKSPPQHEKAGFKYSPFDESEDEELPSTNQAFSLTSTPSKTLTSAQSDDKDGFPFVNYDQGMYAGNTDKAEKEETQGTISVDTGPKPPDKQLQPPEQVQASTICITPVVDSPKQDECAINTKTPPPVNQIAPQIAGVPDYGRRLGTLTAVKQEGASRRRSSKHHQLSESDLQVEEISDSDNTTQSEEVMKVQDPMMAGGSAASPGPANSHPVSPHEESGSSIPNAMEEQQDTIMEIDGLSQIDSEDQRHDFVDLDNSLLQILPDMSVRGPDGIIHEIVEIDDSDEVKGEPREKETNQSTDSDQTRLQVLMELQKKIAAQINTENKGAANSSETLNPVSATENKAGDLPEDSNDYESYMAHPVHPFMGRGFGHRGCGGFRGRGGFGHRMFARGGFGGRGAMFGRGGLFGRGAHMMGFGPPIFGEKKPWKCELCGSSFNNKTNYESHMLKHENKGQCDAGLDESVGMSCPYCKKRFRYKSWLDQHITTHTKEKLFHCPYCAKAYTRRRNVRKHIQMFHPELLMGHVIETDDTLGTVKQQDVDINDS